MDIHGRCSDCGRTANAPRHAIADFPDLATGDPRGWPTCIRCFADDIADRTGLSPRLARVLALELAGYSYSQISTAEGRSVTRIKQCARRIQDRHKEVREEYEMLSALFQYL